MSAGGAPALGRWTPVFAAAAVFAVVIFVGFSGGENEASSTTFDQDAGLVDDSGTAPPSSEGPQVVIPTNPSIEKTQLATELKINSQGLAVAALQNRLKELKFDPGPSDGYFGKQTRQAVWAFEKLILGIPREQATGHVSNEMWQTMQDPIEVKPRRLKTQIYGERPTHVEIYLPEQVLIVFTDDKPVLITHISSGSGEIWCEVITYSIDAKGEPLPEPRTVDECGESKTPGGIFAFYLRYEGNRVGPLGGMWNPVFFNYGIAVHGADSVPNEPASHGCIRIPQLIANYFPSLVQNKDRVYVWDGIKEPEDYKTKASRTPPGNYPNPAATTSTSTTVKAAPTTTVPATAPATTTPVPTDTTTTSTIVT